MGEPERASGEDARLNGHTYVTDTVILIRVIRSIVSELSESTKDERPESEYERPRAEEGRSEGDGEERADAVLDLIGQRDARRLLAYARLQPMSARELADRCGISLPTVYRRTDTLVKHDLLDEQTQIDRSGNHHRTFETSIDRISMIVEGGAFGVNVQFRRDLTDKFEEFWEQLAGKAVD